MRRCDIFGHRLAMQGCTKSNHTLQTTKKPVTGAGFKPMIANTLEARRHIPTAHQATDLEHQGTFPAPTANQKKHRERGLPTVIYCRPVMITPTAPSPIISQSTRHRTPSNRRFRSPTAAYILPSGINTISRPPGRSRPVIKSGSKRGSCKTLANRRNGNSITSRITRPPHTPKK